MFSEYDLVEFSDNAEFEDFDLEMPKYELFNEDTVKLIKCFHKVYLPDYVFRRTFIKLECTDCHTRIHESAKHCYCKKLKHLECDLCFKRHPKFCMRYRKKRFAHVCLMCGLTKLRKFN